MAVARVAGAGYETPMVEDAGGAAGVLAGHRRMSESRVDAHPHQPMTASLYGQQRPLGGHTGQRGMSTSAMPTVQTANMNRKSQSEADSVNQYPEVNANSIDDGLRALGM